MGVQFPPEQIEEAKSRQVAAIQSTRARKAMKDAAKVPEDVLAYARQDPIFNLDEPESDCYRQFEGNPEPNRCESLDSKPPAAKGEYREDWELDELYEGSDGDHKPPTGWQDNYNPFAD